MKWLYSFLSTLFLFCICSSLLLVGSVYESIGAEPSIEVTGNSSADIGNRLTVSQIESLGLENVTINDPFEKSNRSYSGVLLGKFVAQFGKAGATKVTFKAIDDYEVAFTEGEWEKTRILVVTRTSGHLIDFDDKGPLRIVYPDYDPKKHDSKVIMPRWIWMIQSVHFE